VGSFDGRTAIVTGGARGIGEATGRRLVADGASVISFDQSAPQSPVSGIRYLTLDVTSSNDVRDAVRDVLGEEGSVDILDHNAGIQRVGLSEEGSPADWDLVIRVHQFGAYNCTAAVIPSMKTGRGGAIVNVASVAGLLAVPGRSAYAAAKAGIMALTWVTALERASSNLRANAVAPGFTRTALIDQALRDGSLSEEWMKQEEPLGRLARPDEIASAIAWLASDESS